MRMRTGVLAAVLVLMAGSAIAEDQPHKMKVVTTFTVLADMAQQVAGDAAEAFERLPIVQDAAILQNILYPGVWTRFEAAFRTKQEEPT